ncbi:hypothetical protein CsSME_00003179 [Camellia sinensis var. sinensis]
MQVCNQAHEDSNRYDKEEEKRNGEVSEERHCRSSQNWSRHQCLWQNRACGLGCNFQFQRIVYTHAAVKAIEFMVVVPKVHEVFILFYFILFYFIFILSVCEDFILFISLESVIFKVL